MRALLSGLVPGLPAAATRSILERAGGIPLYAVEMIRMLVGSGALVPAGDGTYRATKPLDAIDIPPSLRSLVAARLDALPAADRALLQDAAVLGQTFAVEALASLTGESARDLGAAAARLIARDLLVLDTDPRSPERGQYGFVQSVIREVAYDTLAKRDRRARHLAAARYFEALGDEELSGALATHYQAAYRAAAEGPEADALAVQARIALRAAGERAASLGSPMQAIGVLDVSVGVARSGSRTGSSWSSGRGRSPRRRAVTSRPWACSSARSRAGSRSATGRGRRVRALPPPTPRCCSGATGSGRSSIAHSSISVHRTRGDRGWLELRAIEARSLLRAFQPRASIDLIEEILPEVERLGDLRFALHCFETYAHALHELGRPIHSLLIHEGVLRHAMELGEMALVERVRINLAVLRMEDDPAVAHELNTAGFDDALRRGSLSIAAFFAGNAGEVEARLGDWATARERWVACWSSSPRGSIERWSSTRW